MTDTISSLLMAQADVPVKRKMASGAMWQSWPWRFGALGAQGSEFEKLLLGNLCVGRFEELCRDIALLLQRPLDASYISTCPGKDTTD